MKTVVLAGGGLSSWFACGQLLSEGEDIEVLVLDLGPADAQLRGQFVETLIRNGISVIVQDRRPDIAEYGVELARFQGRYSNGYWNTTSISRACIAFSTKAHLAQSKWQTVAHGCVAFGNDQRRMDRLFGDLAPDVLVRPISAELYRRGEALTRRQMVAAIDDWFSFRSQELDEKVIWSIDGSIIGCAHEGAPIENLSEGWRSAPFVLTTDPFADLERERVDIQIDRGRVVAVNGETEDALAAIVRANAIAGRHGIGRLGVMEDKLSGNKCRGVYEAPGVDLIGVAYGALYNASFPADNIRRLELLFSQYARDVYAGEYYTNTAADNRQRLYDLTGAVSGSISMLLRGGYWEVERIETSCDPGSIERRFQVGGVAWENVPIS